MDRSGVFLRSSPSGGSGPSRSSKEVDGCGVLEPREFGNIRRRPPSPPAFTTSSSNDDPGTTDHSSFAIDWSCMPQRNSFDAFPNELIIYILSFPPLPAVVRFGSTSCRHKSIASAEQIWFPVALNTVKDNVDPNDTLVDENFMRRNCSRFLAALHLEGTETTPEAWYKIATKLLEQVEWTLGWWLEMVSGLQKGRIWRIFIVIDERGLMDHDQDHRFFRTIAAPVEVIENQVFSPPFNGPFVMQTRPTGNSILKLLGVDGSPSSVSLEGFQPLAPTLTGPEALSGDLVFSGRHPPADMSTSYSVQKLPDYLAHLPEYGPERIVTRRWRASFADAPYPPPLLSQLLNQSHRQGRLGQPQIPSIKLLLETGSGMPEGHFLSIHRPSSFSKVPNQLLDSGIYVAPFTNHGWEYLLVRVRELTEEDFQSTWPWEGSLAVAPDDVVGVTDEADWENPHHHLGPFSGIRPTNSYSWDSMRVSRDHVRRGSRILEGIKIKGGSNVPGGQRSFIAFLNDPLVQQEALQEAENSFPEVSPEGGHELPWPFVSKLPTTASTFESSTYTQSFFSPERGIDIPGVMRGASLAFSQPRWADCVVHVECKTKFTVAWFGTRGVVFRKLGDWTCTA
ncbi:hypothetical protein FRC04_010776 [Tulasnella sp. 424]|nr:hypothetical protein FRC04_010776 [Tulasnella sp. 424]KAG8969300.1 hypothetical protein FRC05_001160 [Tulasnella sp. 425]